MNSATSLKVGEGGLACLGIGLELRGRVKLGLKSGRDGVHWVKDEVTSVGSENEVSNRHLVAGSVLAIVVQEVFLDQAVESSANVLELGDSSSLGLLISCEENTSCSAHNITPSINDRVAVARSLEVLGIIVAKPLTKVAVGSAELGVLLTIDLGLWEAGAELTGRALAWHNLCALPSLTGVGAHLLKRVSTAFATTEIGDVDGAWDGSLLASAARRIRSRCGCGGIAAHGTQVP